MAKVTKRKIETGTSDKVAPKSGPRQPVTKISRDSDEADADDTTTVDEALHEATDTSDGDDTATDADGGDEADEAAGSATSGTTFRGKQKPQPVTSSNAKKPTTSKTGVKKVDVNKDAKPKSKHTSKRVTEKRTPAASTRYTPPTAKFEELPSPMWVPVLMFTLFLLGMLTIFLNYVSLLPGATSNWYLLLGLGFILGGIITATQYR